MLTVEFEESTISRTQVQLWYNRFEEGREDVNADARPCRPSTSTNDENHWSENIDVKYMILENLRVTIKEVADDIVPKLLNFE